MSRVTRILNASRGATVCEHATLAERPLSRMRGLLGRDELGPGEGLLLTPAPSVHTAFMRFAIDVVFLDRDLKVLRIVERLAPWKATGERHARSVLELPAGEAQRTGISPGDQLELTVGGARAADPPQPPADTLAPKAAQHRWRLLLARRGGAPARNHEPRTQPMRVMVLSADRYFREAVTLLLTRRGCEVALEDRHTALAQRIEREHTEVVLIDAERSLATAARTAAAVQALGVPVGIVMVDSDPELVMRKLDVLPKWGAFDQLFAAIERAWRERARLGALRQTASGARP